MAHLSIDERKQIEFLLKCGDSVTEIARKLGRPPTTVTRELKSRRIDSSKGVRAKNAVCVHYPTCERTHVCDTNCGMNKWCKHCHQCFLQCRDFEPRTCERLAAAPFVCNGCPNERVCILPKKFYLASGAQENYAVKLSGCRSGVRESASGLKKMNDALAEGVKRRQSVRHIMAANKEAFHGLSAKTVYTYIESKLFDVVRGDLPYACMRRKPKKAAVTKTNARCRVGRTYKEYLAFLAANPGIRHVELDTVIGRVGGKVLFTLQFECGLMLAFLRDRETSQTCTGIFNMLYRIAKPELFSRLFPVVLTDNGAPFSDPVMIENARAPHNPYKLIPRTKLFYCDAYCSTQKPHVERNHLEVRRILEKGTSFDTLDQQDVNLAMSHINSYTRGALGDKSPYDRFVEEFGKEGRDFLTALGIVRISANEVTLCPMLLGAKFQRHADKVTLRKAGLGKNEEK